METPETHLDAERVLNTYGNQLFRLCLLLLGSRSDAEDAVQDTLLQYLNKAPDFVSPAHEKAWLLTVAKNQCRDLLRARARHPQVPLDALTELKAPGQSEEQQAILAALMRLPPAFRLVLHLHYVEGYTTAEIGKMLQRTPSAIKMRLHKGRKLLAEAYGKEIDADETSGIAAGCGKPELIGGGPDAHPAKLP